jgi:hypothetical protein
MTENTTPGWEHFDVAVRGERRLGGASRAVK